VTVVAVELKKEGKSDIVAGTAPGATAFKVFDGLSLNVLQSTLPFPGFAGGISVS